MAFKLGKAQRYDGSFNARKPDDPLSFKGSVSKQGEINTVSLEGNTLAEANMAGSISVDPSLDLNSAFGKKTMRLASSTFGSLVPTVPAFLVDLLPAEYFDERPLWR